MLKDAGDTTASTRTPCGNSEPIRKRRWCSKITWKRQWLFSTCIYFYDNAVQDILRLGYTLDDDTTRALVKDTVIYNGILLWYTIIFTTVFTVYIYFMEINTHILYYILTKLLYIILNIYLTSIFAEYNIKYIICLSGNMCDLCFLQVYNILRIY